jgi:hypothetical protein
LDRLWSAGEHTPVQIHLSKNGGVASNVINKQKEQIEDLEKQLEKKDRLLKAQSVQVTGLYFSFIILFF